MKKTFNSLWKKQLFHSVKKTAFQKILLNFFWFFVKFTMCVQWNKASCLTVLSTHSGIHMVSIEISFFDPHSLKNLITRFACYYSLRSYSQLASLVIRFLSLWGSKNEISLSTKWIPLFVANTVKQKPLKIFEVARHPLWLLSLLKKRTYLSWDC